MTKFNEIKNLIGNTPLVDVKYKFNEKIRHVYCKCEWFNLTGSIKDRVAYQILKNAYRNKKLKNGDKIAEVSSGNMGISFCAIGNIIGNETTIFMPQNMSEERKRILKLYGAKLILTNDFKEAFSLCESYEKKGYFVPHQFSNINNYYAHYFHTAKEIVFNLGRRKPKIFVSGVGTSGTLSGIGSFLKKKLNVKVFAIEPKNSRILSGKTPFKKHELQGFADEICPKLYKSKLIDRIIQISDNDAIAMSQKLCKKLSLGVGITSGANFLGCVLSGQNAITIFPDDNKKYLSTKLCINAKSKIVSKINLISIKAIT